jgi:chromosome segregation ATPase
MAAQFATEMIGTLIFNATTSNREVPTSAEEMENKESKARIGYNTQQKEDEDITDKLKILNDKNEKEINYFKEELRRYKKTIDENKKYDKKYYEKIIGKTNKRYNKLIEEYEKSVDVYQKIIEETNERYDNLREEYEKLREEYEKLEETNEALDDKYHQKTIDIYKKMIELEETNEVLDVENGTLNEEVKKLKEYIRNYNI